MKISVEQLREMINEELAAVGVMGGCDCCCGDPNCECECPECSGGHGDSMGADCDPDDEGHGGVSMAHGELLKIKEAAEGICEMIEGCDEIPAWVESKIATAADRLDSVYHYLAGRAHR